MLYHREVYWPYPVERLAPKGMIPLLYSNHARQAARNDRYGEINLPEVLNSEKALFFECEVDGKEIKYAVRTHLDARRDVILVIMRTAAGWLVKTVWCNLKTDNHKTLAKKNYARA